MRIEHSMIENIDFGLNKQSIHCGIELQYCNIAGSHTFVLKSTRAQLWFIDGAKVWEIPNMISFLRFLIKPNNLGSLFPVTCVTSKIVGTGFEDKLKAVFAVCIKMCRISLSILCRLTSSSLYLFYTFGRIDSIQSHIKESHNDAITDTFQLRVE